MFDLQHLASIKAKFGIIGNAPTLLQAISVAEQVAATDMTVLITGESGSFTGAIESRKGYFEVTDGGTIFLDEIAEMPLGTQARLLRILENGEFLRVGSSKVQKTNVRVVAATNLNLPSAIEKGKFREDLYYRLSTVPIYVPPLRERGDDIELLFRKFTTDFSELHRVRPISLSNEAKELLQKQRFPGNIRQLKNLAEQISVLEMGDRILDADRLQYYLDFNEPKIGAKIIRNETLQGADNLSEREILYKILFDLKKDVTELKRILLQLMEQGNDKVVDILHENMAIFQEVVPATLSNLALPMSSPSPNSSPVPVEEPFSPITTVEILSNEESTGMTQDVTLSLEKQEKEMIIRALKKNRNKRKYAAKDLGISERTLYRKIKQYDLEDLV